MFWAILDPDSDPVKRGIIQPIEELILWPPDPDPNPESDFQPFGDSRSGFISSKKWNRSTSNSKSK